MVVMLAGLLLVIVAIAFGGEGGTVSVCFLVCFLGVLALIFTDIVSINIIMLRFRILLHKIHPFLLKLLLPQPNPRSLHQIPPHIFHPLLHSPQQFGSLLWFQISNDGNFFHHVVVAFK